MLRMTIMGIMSNGIWVGAHRFERLCVHVSYLQSVNHDSNLRPYLLELVVSRISYPKLGNIPMPDQAPHPPIRFTPSSRFILRSYFH